jgi:protein tyrosine phosphatase
MQYLIYSLIGLLSLVIAGHLEALTDSERILAFEALVTKDSRGLPERYIRWLDKQSSPLDHSAIIANYSHVKDKVGRISKYINKPSTVGSRKENIGKNAHPKFLPIDETRTLRHFENYYISANDVLTPLQEYIVGQAPLETTIPDFWRAVLETRSPTIITLSMPSDAGGRNPAYWEKSRYPLTVGEWTIQHEGKEEVLDVSDIISTQRIVRRKFTAIHADSKEEQQIQQIHYENWPDNGAPEPCLFSRFLPLITTLHPVSSSSIVVHCSAGLGRSGTFVTAHSLYKEIQQRKLLTVNIPQRIIELRMQRARLVSTAVQFKAIYEAVRNVAGSSRTSKDLSKVQCTRTP